MTTSSLLRFLALAAVVVAAPAGAQSSAPPVTAARPAPPTMTPRTVPAVRAQPRAIPPAPQPALPSARQTPTPAVVLPPRTVIVNDTARVAAQAASPAPVVADVAPAPTTRVAAPAAAPLPVINQPGPPPANATGRCKDGTYLIGSAATDANCSTRGGLGVAFPQASRPARVP